MPTCGAPTKAGTACKVIMNLSASSGLCVMHDPERLAARKAVQAAGGKASGVAIRRAKAANPETVPKAPKTLEDAVKVASWITRAVLVGEIDVRVAEAATKAVRQFQLGEEKRSYEAEIKDLQARLDKYEKRSGRVA